MIARTIASAILRDAVDYPAIAIIGPRQSGKTTLAQALFPEKYYRNLENPEERAFALEDPRGFLEERKNGMIIDEFQRVPGLLSWIQTIADKEQIPGQFILTGSQNFLMMEQISQSLAGRISLFTLLPLSMEELQLATIAPGDLNSMLFRGFFPRLYDRSLDPERYYSNYVKTYLERDVRQLKNIGDLNLFRDFLLLCAGRTGQIVNYSSLGNDVGISHNTVKAWLTLLEISNIIYKLRPFHKNFNKQIVKSPKLYFCDTGLLCHLLGIEEPESISRHFLKGGIFENFVIGELLKGAYSRGKEGNFHFWRDKRGHEVDLLINRGPERSITLEIKAGSTISSSFFSNLDYYGTLDSSNVPRDRYLVYGGAEHQDRSRAKVRSWREMASLVTELLI
jgi:uncharacterized protein